MTHELLTADTLDHLSQVTDYLRDAVVELETWRQNARTPEERQALYRVTGLLGQAVALLQANEEGPDPAQQALALPEERG